MPTHPALIEKLESGVAPMAMTVGDTDYWVVSYSWTDDLALFELEPVF
jgi:hypothetical protein